MCMTSSPDDPTEVRATLPSLEEPPEDAGASTALSFSTDNIFMEYRDVVRPLVEGLRLLPIAVMVSVPSSRK